MSWRMLHRVARVGTLVHWYWYAMTVSDYTQYSDGHMDMILRRRVESRQKLFGVTIARSQEKQVISDWR